MRPYSRGEGLLDCIIIRSDLRVGGGGEVGELTTTTIANSNLLIVQLMVYAGERMS
jgi:hypothetical protein